MASNQQLPTREANTFKKILRCYEDKQHRMGLKLCQKILSQPGLTNHGETLSMKGLLLSQTDKKQEGFECARLGLRNNLASHVCWHIMGLVHRAEKNYVEAIKCYRQALSRDKENLQILRDLAVLQIHMRDLQGYASTRRTILSIRSSQRASWLGYAVAEHLLGNFELAVEILSSYEQSMDLPPSTETELTDVSEFFLYKASLLMESSKLEAALESLKASSKYITDKAVVREMSLEILTKLGRPEAPTLAREMLQQNPANRDYLLNLEAASGMSQAPAEKRLQFFKALEQEFPTSNALRRMPLLLTTGAEFEAAMDAHLRSGLRKGIVSLIRSIHSLYATPEKAATIDKLLTGYLANLKAKSKFDDKDDSKVEVPSTMIWTLYAVAQHHDKLQRFDVALEHINAAIEHTPTLVDLYMIKAKILKHQSKFLEAAETIDIGRDLDTADRYLNCKAVKYFLRAGNVPRAETLAAMFTREGNNDPIAQLTEMQCIWFEMGEANAFLQNGQTGRALKKLHAIDAHFTQFIEDQFDFHTFSFRKMTLRAYIRLLRFEDTLHSHKYFVRAALLAIATYIGLHDQPFVLPEEKAQDAATEGMSESEKKKLLSKQRKAAKRAEAQQPPAKAEVEDPKQGEKDKPKDTDPDGLLLAKTATPLDDALKFLRPLLIHARNNIDVHLAAFEIYSRKKKPLLMLQALVRANSLEPQNARLVEARSQFIKLVAAEGKSWNAKVLAVVADAVKPSSELFKTAGVDLATLF